MTDMTPKNIRTVRELISALRALPPEMPVSVGTSSGVKLVVQSPTRPHRYLHLQRADWRSHASADLPEKTHD